MSFARFAFSLLCTALIAFAPAPFARAQTEAAPPPPLFVSVRIKNAGGLPTEGRDKNLHEQFAGGLRDYLAGIAKKSNAFVVGPDAKSRPPKNARVLLLDGELSRTPNADGGAYFVIVRAVQEKPTRQTVAAWAGIAQNYRYLSGNLDSRPDVNREGLLGELGKQIAVYVQGPAAPANDLFSAGLQKALQAGRVIATVVPSDGPAAPAVAAPTLRSEQSYRIKIAAEDAGSVYILREDGSQLISLFMPDTAPSASQTVEPGKPLLIPFPQTPSWKAPKTGEPLTQTLLVLVRRKTPALPQTASTAAPALRLARLAAFAAPNRAGDSLPVQVIRTPADPLPPAAPDAVREKMAQLLAAGPEGTWTAQRITIQILPKSKEKP